MGRPPPEPTGQSHPVDDTNVISSLHTELSPPHIPDDSDSDDDDETSHLNNQNVRRLSPPPILTDHRRFPSIDETDTDHVALPEPEQEVAEKPVTWSSLPKKGQLAILTMARLSEPLTQTSLQAYMFYQLKSFDPSLPDSTISAQAGMLQGSFTAAQFLTAVWWGRLADAEWMGRKRVLMIGLFGTCISALGFGFSRSFTTAILFRTLGGLLNSNQGVMRTMISEIVVEKKYQSRAFLLLPMCFNIGVIIGPVLGGTLADPVNSLPWLFGPGSPFGGKSGVWWMQHWPYALPNLLSACFIFMSSLAIFFGLDESHEIARHRRDWGRELGKRIVRTFTRRPLHYSPLVRSGQDNSMYMDENTEWSAPSSPVRTRPQRPLVPRKRAGFRQIFTRNVLLTLLTHFLLAFHTSAFNSMTFVFLPTPRAPEGSRTDFFHFSGGLGLPSARVGLATAIIGFIGLPLQILLYPRIQGKLGTLTSFRTFLPLSPIAYILMPFLVILPRVPYIVWPSFTFVVSLQVISRTFVLPAAIILVNNCVTDSTILGTVHGVAQSISSAARTLGPLLGGWGLGLGLEYNMVGAIWWALAAESLIGYMVLWTIYEGKGIERRKPDEDEVEEEEP
ncbi:hypothetical protein N7466_004851 [Penicillium verhagenii]|uniref:uncharacterized protein n=1 Tax=Penicillium verhagenii TaxID=1562060 RepID=UPI002544E18B|nr:uncharacterized protein N7466_004851 [Penicillium verhagenii]KAJ5935304.1 hypothetical protein N7466_004851 [Penicillium verhagenii]